MSDTQETWKNVTAGTVVLKRLDHRGELTRDEIVIGDKSFHITSAERRLNQESAADEELDVFKNGTLHPLRLIEDSEEALEIASNPNLMSESDMQVLIKAHFKTFAKGLSDIGNVTTLQRLLSMARSEDASISRVEAISDRIAEMNPTLINDVQVVGTSPEPSRGGPAPGMRPVTTR
jgi:hypothetical protein